MARGRPRKNPADVLIKSAELIGWALGGIEREIVETRQKLASLTAQANQLRTRVGKGATRAGQPGAAEVSQNATEQNGEPQRRKRRRSRMSPEGRKRISEMMKKRWADRRKANK